MSYAVRFLVRNTHAEEIEVDIEPWGEVHVLAPQRALELLFEAPEPGLIEVETGERRTTVYGWSRSVVSVTERSA